MKISKSSLKLLDTADALDAFRRIQRGIEKESLRKDSTGKLALTPHPRALGSALCNDWLTTDFSEALLEFITPVHRESQAMLNQLADLHRFTTAKLDDELLWPSSMPGELPPDSEIPLAEYGNSNVGLMKTAYRRGLGNRYGRAMQCVAGIHYNFSLPSDYWQIESQISGDSTKKLQNYANYRYFDLIRNFRRNYWLLIYLFGASPAADPSFVQGREHNLETLSTDDLYLPYATSLRMGDLGYQSKAQQALFVCYNELQTYIETLRCSLKTEYPPYKKFGVCVDGIYEQLSTSILQIENEFYSSIRPKRVAQSGQTPANALANGGIEYIEVRCLDLDPFESNGIHNDAVKFIDLFLLTCLLTESPACNEQEFRAIAKNQSRVVNEGRKPGLSLVDSLNDYKETPLATLANSILDNMLVVANAMSDSSFKNIIANAREKVTHSEITPSGKVLGYLMKNKLRHMDFGVETAKLHRAKLSASSLKDTIELQLSKEVQASFEKQKEVEASDSISFEEYLSNYFSQ